MAVLKTETNTSLTNECERQALAEVKLAAHKRGHETQKAEFHRIYNTVDKSIVSNSNSSQLEVSCTCLMGIGSVPEGRLARISSFGEVSF